MKKKKNVPEESIMTSENNFQEEKIIETNTLSNVSQSDFEQQLIDFFNKNKPSKVKKAKQLAQTFKGKEQEVLEHLHNKYVHHQSTVIKHKNVTNKVHHEMPNGHEELTSGGETVSNEAKPKKSKKMLVIVLVIILAVGGAGIFFMMKGKHSKGEAKEEAKTSTKEIKEVKASTPTEEKKAE